ncbi:MAG TPA: hypothetical protein VFC93_22075 [Chloroflexota bacterium]|nr:hypothetical protein [Chloroflexota bacterium]
MPVGVSLSTLSSLSSSDRQFVRALVDASVEKARSQHRHAVAALFAALSDALGSPDAPTSVVLEAAADLDAEELDAILDGFDARARRERAEGNLARAELFRELRAGLEAERERRGAVLAALDRSMTWYETHLSGDH